MTGRLCAFARTASMTSCFSNEHEADAGSGHGFGHLHARGTVRPATAIVSGRASSDGTLTFTGTARDSAVNVEFQNVGFELPHKGEMMTGTFEQLYTSSDSRSGTLRVFAKLRTMQGPQ